MVMLAASLVTVTTAALLVARDAVRARLEEILSGSTYTARAVAGSVQRQIEVFSRAVTESARDENFRAALAASDAIPLREHVRRMLDEHNRPGTPWRTSPAAREPFTSFFVVDATGVMRAHAPLYRATGEDFSTRDYFQNGRRLPDGQPYVSRLYKAVTDGKYKIAIAVPIRQNETLFGLLVASISIDSQFGDLQLDDDARQVALVSPLEAPHDDQLVLFRHPRYDQQSEAHEIASPPLARFAAGDATAATDAQYRDPLFNERYLASFARVPGTHILVVVQQRYRDALRAGVDPARRIVLWGGAALALAALAIALTSMLLLHRRRVVAAPR
jgi:hypothetical protein